MDAGGRELEISIVHALEDSPWMVLGHYITITKWQPFFSPKRDVLTSTLACVRVPDLPLEIFKEETLLRIGNLLGRALKVDHTSMRVERGKYARICVEINLKKPLGSRIKINRKAFNVEYEGLSQICFNCGLYGHVSDNCGVNKDSDTSHNTTKESPKSSPTAPFGPWMIE